MNLRPTVVLMAALVAGVGAFAWRAVRIERSPSGQTPELRWIQHEFTLSDDTMRRIGALHHDYALNCDARCAALQSSDTEIAHLIVTGRSLTPELETALERSGKLTAECRRQMIEHFYAVANEMPDAARTRYLSLMMPVAIHPEHGWTKLRP